MRTFANTFATRQFQGFTVHTLQCGRASLAVVPELGAKIISLKDLQTQREWLWHPGERLELFKNEPCDAFSDSPLTGMDECLPTILPCTWRGRELPDHGEVWNRKWEVDMDAWQQGVLKTSVQLKSFPFVFERTITLDESEVRLDYNLSNVSGTDEHFLWAVHPLLRLTAGDRLELPGSTRRLLNGAGWVDDVASAAAPQNCAKAFAHPVSEGRAVIKNDGTGDRLEFIWDSLQNNSLGLWITRGGWHGHHHFAVEPSNADHDCLVTASGRNRCGFVAAKSSLNWQIALRVGSE
jgi:galactose mutarotase-like enzyme